MFRLRERTRVLLDTSQYRNLSGVPHFSETVWRVLGSGGWNRINPRIPILLIPLPSFACCRLRLHYPISRWDLQLSSCEIHTQSNWTFPGWLSIMFGIIIPTDFHVFCQEGWLSHEHLRTSCQKLMKTMKQLMNPGYLTESPGILQGWCHNLGVLEIPNTNLDPRTMKQRLVCE